MKKWDNKYLHCASKKIISTLKKNELSLILLYLHLSWSVLEKVWLAAVLPGYASWNLAAHSPHWTFQPKARIWVQRCSVKVHFALAIWKLFRRKRGISKETWLYQLPKQHIQLEQRKRWFCSRELDTLCVHQCVCLRSLQSKSKVQKSQALMVRAKTGSQSQSTRQRGRDAVTTGWWATLV